MMNEDAVMDAIRQMRKLSRTIRVRRSVPSVSRRTRASGRARASFRRRTAARCVAHGPRGGMWPCGPMTAQARGTTVRCRGCGSRSLSVKRGYCVVCRVDTEPFGIRVKSAREAAFPRKSWSTARTRWNIGATPSITLSRGHYGKGRRSMTDYKQARVLFGAGYGRP